MEGVPILLINQVVIPPEIEKLNLSLCQSCLYCHLFSEVLKFKPHCVIFGNLVKWWRQRNLVYERKKTLLWSYVQRCFLINLLNLRINDLEIETGEVTFQQWKIQLTLLIGQEDFCSQQFRYLSLIRWLTMLSMSY